jgi:hypothetical protein
MSGQPQGGQPKPQMPNPAQQKMAGAMLNGIIGNGIAGAGLGAISGGLSGGLSDNGTFLGGAARGALGGGLVGAGAGAISGRIQNKMLQNPNIRPHIEAVQRHGIGPQGLQAAEQLAQNPEFMQSMTNMGRVGLGGFAGAIGVGAGAARMGNQPAQPVPQKLAVLKKKSTSNKIASAPGQLLRPNILHNLENLNEVAGLGVLAAPSIQHLAGGHPSEDYSHAMEVGGLGMLAAPYAGKLMNSASGGRLGASATNMWNRAANSGLANKLFGAATKIAGKSLYQYIKEADYLEEMFKNDNSRLAKLIKKQDAERCYEVLKEAEEQKDSRMDKVKSYIAGTTAPVAVGLPAYFADSMGKRRTLGEQRSIIEDAKKGMGVDNNTHYMNTGGSSQVRIGPAAVGEGLGANISSNSRAPAANLAHEVGHIKNTNWLGNKLKDPLKAVALLGGSRGLGRMGSGIGAIHSAAENDPSYTGAAISGVANLPTLVDEGAASYHALKHLKNTGGMKAMAKGIPSLALGFGSYAAGAAAPLAVNKFRKMYREEAKNKEAT